MTPAVVAAVKVYNKLSDAEARDGEPSLADPVVGNPISHAQLINISKFLKAHREDISGEEGVNSVHLSDLLKGCGIHTPPPAPKPEKSPEYLALMARLRAEAEEKQYNHMLTHASTLPIHTLSQTAASQQGYLYPPLPSKEEDEDMTYADINRQMALIANVLISILACSIGVWKAAWHWDVPSRLALSMASSILVAAAEVAIYAGYIGRLSEARERERKKVEVRRVGERWVIEAGGGGDGGGEKKGVEEGNVTMKVDDVLKEGLRLRGKVGKT